MINIHAADDLSKEARQEVDGGLMAPKPVHPYCNACGWRKGGPDSWDGNRCKCGHWEPAIKLIEADILPFAKKGAT